MKRRDLPGGPVTGTDKPNLALDPIEDSAIEQLIECARIDSPEENLSDRVLEGIAYRESLTKNSSDSIRPFRPLHGSFAAAGVLFLAAAAGVLLWLHPLGSTSKVKISPEQLPTNITRSIPAAASNSKPVADPCSDRKVASGRQPLIDDFEDGDDEVARLEGRSGLWRWVRDTDLPLSSPALLPIPRPNPRPGNQLALHVKGGRLLDWGAVVEFNFVPACYDASAYRGLSFQAKGPGRIFVAPREVGVIPVANGGTCTEDCHNAHVQKIELSAQWKTYEVRFSEVAQRGYSKPAFNPSRLNSLAFQIHPEDTPYDVWLDDVRFLNR
jgi:hypothetical protein